MGTNCILISALLLLSQVAAAEANGPWFPLTFSPRDMSLSTAVNGRRVRLLDHVSYSLRYEDKACAFRAVGVSAVEKTGDRLWRVTYRLEGPAAEAGVVQCTVDARPQRVRLRWTVAYRGPKRKFFGWTDGFRLGLPRKLTSAAGQATIRWVKPTGRHPWEVAGDAPYADLDRHLRRIRTVWSCSTSTASSLTSTPAPVCRPPKPTLGSSHSTSRLRWLSSRSCHAM